MRVRSRQTVYVVVGMALGCLALALSFVLPPLLSGASQVQTSIAASTPPPVDQSPHDATAGQTSSTGASTATAGATATAGTTVTAGTTGTTPTSGVGGGPGEGGSTGSGTVSAATTSAPRQSPARPPSPSAGSPRASSTRTATARPSPSSTDPPTPSGGNPPIALTSRSGSATFYAPAAPGGACLTLTIPPTAYTVAVGPVEFAGSRACGSYVEITGARGTIVAKVDNLCPECGVGHLDLSDEAFAAIDEPAKGQVAITYRGVQNPSLSGGVAFKVKDGSSRYWLGLHVDNTGNPLASVEVASGADALRSMSRSANGFWVLADNPGPGPYRVRVTDIYGHSLLATNLQPDVGLLQQTGLTLY